VSSRSEHTQRKGLSLLPHQSPINGHAIASRSPHSGACRMQNRLNTRSHQYTRVLA
jgi:hypothetical protein